MQNWGFEYRVTPESKVVITSKNYPTYEDAQANAQYLVQVHKFILERPPYLICVTAEPSFFTKHADLIVTCTVLGAIVAFAVVGYLNLG